MKKFLLSLLAIATLASCSKNDDDNNNNGGDNGGGNNTSTGTLPKKITIKDNDGNLMEVTTISFEGEKPSTQSVVRYNSAGAQIGTPQVTTFTYEGNLISKIKREGAGVDNFERRISYENGKITFIIEKNEVDPHTFTFTYGYTGNKLTSILKTYSIDVDVNGSIQSRTLCYDYQYNYNGNIVTKSDVYYEKNKDGKVIEYSTVTGTTVTYTLSNENVVKEEDSENNLVFEYKYDTQHNSLCYDSVKPEDVFSSQYAKNNMLESTITRNGIKNTYVYEYTYNKTGYPTVVKRYSKREDGEKTFLGTTEYEY
ncbi:hypothetical protein RCZ04_02280 [Capnocytophaga sp. HP1101]